MGEKEPTLPCPLARQSRKVKFVEEGPVNGEGISPTRTLLGMVLVSAGLVTAQTAVCVFSFFPQFSFGFFNNGVVKVYNIFRVSISPSELFFSLIPLCQVIWNRISITASAFFTCSSTLLIFAIPYTQIGQVGITGYSLLSMCRRTIQGPRLTNPPVLNTMFFILWNVSTTLNIVWNFIFDKVFLPESAVLEALSISTLVPAFGIASARLAFYRPQLIAEKNRFDRYSLRSGVLNVLAMQITQTVISLIIDITVMASAAFSRPVVQELISSVSLGTMTVLTLIFTGLDMSVLEPYSRGVLSPYITVIMSVASMMRGNWNDTGPASTIKLALIASAITGMLTKLTVSIFNRNKPLQTQVNAYGDLLKKSTSGHCKLSIPGTKQAILC